MYATQPILPLLTDIFGASELAVSLTVTAGGLGIALGAPVAGHLADKWGRKRVIVWSSLLVAITSLAAATSAGLNTLIFWRFVQGLFTPGVFAVTVAYINDEWAETGAASALSSYISGTVVGGFLGRALSGWIASHYSWPWVFVALGIIGMLCTALLAAWLPVERKFHHATVEAGSWFAAARAHLHNGQLVAAFAVGFCALFTLVSTFTYVTFYLAEPPFHLSPAALGSVFTVYLVGAAITPLSGRAIGRFGSRASLAAGIGAGVLGVALTLGQSFWMVALGLTICCSGVFLAQAAATNFIGLATRRNRALAVGMYASCYHAGGSAGGAVPGFFWSLGGWPAVAGVIAAMQVLTVALALGFWKDRRSAPLDEPWAAPAELD
jgi:MFS family permease